MIRVLMVCLGNICRSPMAEAVMKAKVREAGLDDRIQVASAGTGRWHLGEPPHQGTRRELDRHGVPADGMVSQHVTEFDLEQWDYVVPMDESNRQALGLDVPLLLEYADCPEDTCQVPDPYYEGGFDRVYRLVEAGCEALLERIRADHLSPG